MASSGIELTPAGVTQFEDLKIKKTSKCIRYQITDDKKHIDVAKTYERDDQLSEREQFKQIMADAMQNQSFYLVYDLNVPAKSGSGFKGLVLLVSYCTDDCCPKTRMMHAASLQSLKAKLKGIGSFYEAHDENAMEYDELMKLIKY